MEFEGKGCACAQHNNKTGVGNWQTETTTPENYLCKTSPHGGTSDDVGALLGLVLVHALLGLGGFGLGGHLVLDVVVRHGLLLAAGFLWRHEVYVLRFWWQSSESMSVARDGRRTDVEGDGSHPLIFSLSRCEAK